jgi:inner membrane protein
MDSLSQIALGSAVGVAVMGRRTSVWKAALWGAVCGTLPDLDAFIDHGDAVRNMTFHRAESHALFYLSLLSPLIAWLITRIHGEAAQFRRWWLAVWLMLITHPLLDWMTVYGTQLALPFTDHPFAVGSVFIIDPLYTLPLLVGVIAALAAQPARGLRWNATGLALSTAYLAWGVLAQQHVAAVAQDAIRQQGLQAQRVLVTPTAFNTILWRVLVVTPEGYSEGFYSLLDPDRQVRFDAFPRGEALYERFRGHWHVERIAWFSHGFFKMSERDGQVRITDLRMGQEPTYTFSFIVADPSHAQSPLPRMVSERPDLRRALPWLWRRLQGELIPPPR